jgi:hypothetical protein
VLPSWVATLPSLFFVVCGCLSQDFPFYFLWSYLFLLLYLFLRFLCDLREVVYDLRLNLYLSYALLVWPVLDVDHFAFFLMPGLKPKLLFLAIDVEADFSSSNVNLHPCGAKEWSPKNEW